LTSPTTLLVAPDMATAKVIRATLEADGIACAIPDEQTASLGWYLGNVIAGIRVQVDEASLEQAKELLAELEIPPDGERPGDPAEALTAKADLLALRANPSPR
jgi:hypothetical protein